MTPGLDATILADALRSLSLPRTVYTYGSIGSTMDLARPLLKTLPPEQFPILLVADEQRTGRGRKGRPWMAPPGSALLLSLVLQPTWLKPSEAVYLVWMAAVALCEAIETVTPLQPVLKWPNDLLLATPSPAGPTLSKAAGLLLEINSTAEYLAWAIIGCGVNLTSAPPADQTRYPATSLAAAGAEIDRMALLIALMQRIDGWYQRLAAGERDVLFRAWRSRLVTLGQQVRIETADGLVSGLAEQVEPDGTLLVRQASGELYPVTTGDVGL
ncbi:biotin--[acetyl-CoA-carboxylase] ligase [Candidatus Chloroploca asiatica]|uniref:biotin--[biotin carboxyl-carrier protein] ligase n=1 Tax=Candidatus Chloroploca asiatica TaxID=1506545 RepID=A0A2H3LBF3_9CHLR|nr:biotin--[acetyl-CoA-carboxylase] ligase [Candidatus Chloroploca asiatica]PDW00876.1 biotin--[acetyl-CoA-carboxylase] ligase [Candidatus Chloroploca asiatica]